MSRGPRMLPEPVGLSLLECEGFQDWDAVFGFGGSLELEIGCGMGGHALGYCQRYPERRYVAFEWRKKYARDVQRRADLLGLRNLKVIEADARDHVPRLFRPGSLHWIRLQFPDPWWKRAQQKRAILRGSFTELLLNLLAPGGRFDLRTDVEDRAVRMLAELERAGFVNPLGPGAFHLDDPEDVPSSRERRYLLTGQRVYRARLEKPATDVSARSAGQASGI